MNLTDAPISVFLNFYSGFSRPGSAGSGSSKEDGKTTPSQRLTTETVKVRKRNMEAAGVPACILIRNKQLNFLMKNQLNFLLMCVWVCV